jgi:hypothetical protein
MWEIEFTDEFEAWWRELTPALQESLDQRLRLLAARGPGLGRPTVDTLGGSAVPNLKELRAGSVRVLFVFDARRTAILLVEETNAACGAAGTTMRSRRQNEPTPST